MLQEIKHFLIHLRLHYQFFILSGGYLLGGLMANQMNTTQFWLQFLNVHVLLYGGATAYNSFWDKDKGPIGGLRNPPAMSAWMHPLSLFLMLAGWIWSFQIGRWYFIIFGVSLMLFWLYSTPHARWKGDPHLSLIAIGISTGCNSVLLGFWAAGGVFSWHILSGAAGAALVLLSLYPVSQIYQFREDNKRGDLTFFIRYSLKGVKSFFIAAFLTGLVLLSMGLYNLYAIPAIAFFVTGLILFIVVNRFVSGLKGLENEYGNVMRIKLFTSFSYILFILISNAIRYEWIGNTFLRIYF